MTFAVKEYIFRLQVPVDYTAIVQMLQGQNHFSCIESSSLLRKSDLIAQVIEQFSSIKKVRDKVQRIRTLEGEVQLDYEWMINEGHNVPLRLRVLYLVGLYDEVFLESLHRVDFPIRLSLDHVDFAEASSANNFQYGEVVDPQRLLVVTQEGISTRKRQRIL